MIIFRSSGNINRRELDGRNVQILVSPCRRFVMFNSFIKMGLGNIVTSRCYAMNGFLLMS
jgi:hypothetical protein